MVGAFGQVYVSITNNLVHWVLLLSVEQEDNTSIRRRLFELAGTARTLLSLKHHIGKKITTTKKKERTKR